MFCLNVSCILTGIVYLNFLRLARPGILEKKKFRPEKFLLMIHVSVPVYYKGSFFEKITCCIDDNVCIIFYVKFHFKFSQLANTLEIQHINL